MLPILYPLIPLKLPKIKKKIKNFKGEQSKTKSKFDPLP